MELKHRTDSPFAYCICLLIVPYGIETMFYAEYESGIKYF